MCRPDKGKGVTKDGRLVSKGTGTFIYSSCFYVAYVLSPLSHWRVLLKMLQALWFAIRPRLGGNRTQTRTWPLILLERLPALQFALRLRLDGRVSVFQSGWPAGGDWGSGMFRTQPAGGGRGVGIFAWATGGEPSGESSYRYLTNN